MAKRIRLTRFFVDQGKRDSFCSLVYIKLIDDLTLDLCPTARQARPHSTGTGPSLSLARLAMPAAAATNLALGPSHYYKRVSFYNSEKI